MNKGTFAKPAADTESKPSKPKKLTIREAITEGLSLASTLQSTEEQAIVIEAFIRRSFKLVPK